MPLAPPSTLVLAANNFMPFKLQEQQPSSARLVEVTGERLAVREGARAAQSAFDEQVLEPAIEGLLQDDLWPAWQQELDAYDTPADEMAAVLREYALWAAEVAERRRERALQV